MGLPVDDKKKMIHKKHFDCFYAKMCSLALRLFVHLWYFGLFVAQIFFVLLLFMSIYSIQLRASEKVDFTVMIIKRIEKLR